MKRILIIFGIFLISFINAFPTSINLNIQVEDSGIIKNGTFNYQFNISTTQDCNSVVYSNSSTITTDLRGIFYYSLGGANLIDYTNDLFLCVYRDGILKSNNSISSIPYSFYSNSSDYWDSLNTFNSTQMQNSNGILDILPSWLTSFINSIINFNNMAWTNQTNTFTLNQNFSQNISVNDTVFSDKIQSINGNISFFNSTGNEKVRITNEGKVGIGTLSPSLMLNIKGDLSVNLTGTVSVLAGTDNVTGVGTLFTTQLFNGDAIKIAGEIFTVSNIVSNTKLSLDSNHISGASGVIAYKDPDFFAIDDGDSSNKFKITKSGHIGIGLPPNQNKLLYASETFNTTGTVYSSDLLATNFGSGSIYGILAKGLAQHPSGTMGYVFGGYYYGQHSGAGKVTNLEGIHAMTGGSGTGNVTYNTPIEVMWSLTSGATDTARGIWIGALGGGSTVTNVYGIQITEMTKGTNTYQIYSEGGNTYFAGTGSNYFGGDIHNIGKTGIGTTTPAYKLDVKSISSTGTGVFNGSGRNDMTSGGVFLGTNLTLYKVSIDGISNPNTFKWSDDGGETWDATGVVMNGSTQTLNNGVTVNFSYSNSTIDTATFNDVTYMGTLDDMTSGGTYTGGGILNYWIEIDGEGSPDTFKWSDDNDGYTPPETWDAEGVAITGSAQTLSNGVTVTFGSTSGTHYISDYWTFQANNHIIGDNWTFNATVTNPFSVQDSSGTRIFDILNSGDVNILKDSSSLTFGASQDAKIYWDGTNLIFNTNATSPNTGIAWFSNNVSAENIIDRSWYWDDKLGSSLSHVKNSIQLKDKFGKFDDNLLPDFEKATYQVTDFSRPVYINTTKEICGSGGGIITCKNIITTETTYPYTKTETGRLVSATIGKHEQNIYDLLQENNKLKERVTILENKLDKICLDNNLLCK